MATTDPHAAGAAREITSHKIHTESEKLGHVQSLFHVADNLLGLALACFEIEVSDADSGRSRQTARRIARSLHVELLCRVGVQQVGLEHAFVDHHRAPRFHAFAIERRRAKASGHGPVVDDSYVFSRDLLAQLSRKEGCAAIDRIPIHRFRQAIE